MFFFFAVSRIKTMSRAVTDTGTEARKETRTRRKAVTKTRTKKRTISLLWKSVLLREELNRVKAAGHAEEATFAAGRSTLQALSCKFECLVVARQHGNSGPCFMRPNVFDVNMVVFALTLSTCLL